MHAAVQQARQRPKAEASRMSGELGGMVERETKGALCKLLGRAAWGLSWRRGNPQ